MASHGGTISIEARSWRGRSSRGRSAASSAARRLAERIGHRRTCSAPTSAAPRFDIALITDGRFEITPDAGHRPLPAQHAAGQDRLDRRRHRLVRARQPELRTGPSSAPTRPAPRIGVCWPEGGLETVSVTDLNLVLGRVNPDYFLGGDVKLDPERARAEVERQVAEPLGLGVEEAAAGVIELFEQTLKNEAVGRILGKGYSPADYALLCYGGGGPLHVAGYTEGVAYRDVLVPAWAAGFSAFGCACADFEYRYDQTIDMPILPDRRRDGEGGRGDDDHGRLAGLAGAGGRRVREVGRRARRDRLHPRGADAVLRPAQRHRDRLPAHGARGGRAASTT